MLIYTKGKVEKLENSLTELKINKTPATPEDYGRSVV